MGRYPLIKMTLKSAKQPDFYGAFMMRFQNFRLEVREIAYAPGMKDGERVGERLLRDFVRKPHMPDFLSNTLNGVYYY